MTSNSTTSNSTTPTAASSRATLAQDREERITSILTGTATAVGTDPGRAAVQFTASGSSTGSVATDVQARQHSFVVDEPASLAGDDSATNPVEYALGALIGCQVVTYRFWASKLGIALDDVQIDAVGDLDVQGFFGLDESVRPGFGSIKLDVRITGPESPERYAELHAAVDEHCPVLDLFTNPTPVSTAVTTVTSS